MKRCLKTGILTLKKKLCMYLISFVSVISNALLHLALEFIPFLGSHSLDFSLSFVLSLFLPSFLTQPCTILSAALVFGPPGRTSSTTTPTWRPTNRSGTTHWRLRTKTRKGRSQLSRGRRLGAPSVVPQPLTEDRWTVVGIAERSQWMRATPQVKKIDHYNNYCVCIYWI